MAHLYQESQQYMTVMRDEHTKRYVTSTDQHQQMMRERGDPAREAERELQRIKALLSTPAVPPQVGGAFLPSAHRRWIQNRARTHTGSIAAAPNSSPESGRQRPPPARVVGAQHRGAGARERGVQGRAARGWDQQAAALVARSPREALHGQHAGRETVGAGARAAQEESAPPHRPLAVERRPPVAAPRPAPRAAPRAASG